MKNSISGEVRQVSWDHMIELADKSVRERLCTAADREGVAGMVMYEVLDMSSSQHGRRSFLVYGPGCVSAKTLEEAIAGRLGDVPSRFAYPVAYWSQS